MKGKKSLRERLGMKDYRNMRERLGLDRSVRERLGPDGSGKKLRIGTDRDTGVPAFFNLDLFNTHLHVVGRTGTGKTRFLALLARQILELGMGGCVIDIQGGLYHLVENYVAHHPELAKRVIFLNPGEAQDPLVSFNPLSRPSYLKDPQSRVDMMIEAIMKHMKQADEVMPTFKNVSSNILPALMHSGNTILEGKYFSDWMNVDPRNKMLHHVSDDVQRFWRIYDDQPKREKKIDILSFNNRINEFIRYEMLRYTLGRTENLMNFKDLFDKDKFLLVNLRYPTHLSFDAATLIGICVINELFYYAMTRDDRQAKKHPFVLMIDEMQNFITPDLVRILDQCRQKGLHLVLAHQRLQQLKKLDEGLYSAVNSNARTKVVFSVPMEDAKLLADDIFEHDLYEVKHQLKTVSIVDYARDFLAAEHESESSGTGKSQGITKTKARSSTDGVSHTTGRSESVGGSGSWGTSRGEQSGWTWPVDYNLDLMGGHQSISSANTIMDSYGSFDSSSTMEATGEAHAESEMKSMSKSEIENTFKSGSTGKSKIETIVPVLGEQITQETLFSLEDQRYRAAIKLQKQPLACAYIKRKDDPPQMVAIKEVPDYDFDEQKIREAHDISKKTNPYYCSIEKSKKSIEKRHKQLELIDVEVENVDSEEVKSKPKSDDIISEEDYRE